MLHLEILDETRRRLLPKIAKAGEAFYLAGGTALALQLGHRDSIDFDFFSPEPFDTRQLFQKCERIFAGNSLLKTQEETNTLSLSISEEVRLSFFGYPYELLEPLIQTEQMSLASPLDIGVMKLSAITSRSTLKDYVDLYFILQTSSLGDLLAGANKKFPSLDQNLILKSLVYFADITDEPIMYQPGFNTDQATIENFLRQEVETYIKHSK